MKYQEALIAWNPRTDLIRVGPLLRDEDTDWTKAPIHYHYTGGAAYTWLRECTDQMKLATRLFIEFHTIVVRDKIPIGIVHKEFLKIDQYRALIAPDIDGAEQRPEEDDC